MHVCQSVYWKSSCIGNKYRKLKYEVFEIKRKPESDRTFDDMRALHYYELWMSNAIRKLKRATEVNAVQQKKCEHVSLFNVNG